jgi:hypothetical protein
MGVGMGVSSEHVHHPRERHPEHGGSDGGGGGGNRFPAVNVWSKTLLDKDAKIGTPNGTPNLGERTSGEQRLDPLVEHLERCAGGRQALYLGPVDEKKRRIGRGAQMAREGEVGCSLGVRGAVLQAPQHLSSANPSAA